MSTVWDELWEVDWRRDLREELMRQGFASVTQYLQSQPAISYWELSERLEERFAPMQLMIVQAEEAIASGQVRNAAQDCLARKIIQHLPAGWGQGKKLDFNTAGVFTDWVEFLEHLQANDHPGIQHIWKDLKNRAHSRWQPIGAHDPLLSELFDLHWNT